MQLWPQGLISFWVGVGLTFAGLLFSVWARMQLGRNWSRSVTIKQDHELIVTGPYALVRHPIYTGLLAAFLGTVLAVGEVRAVLAFVLIAVQFGYKLQLEEKWMRAQFGAAYAGHIRTALQRWCRTCCKRSPPCVVDRARLAARLGRLPRPLALVPVCLPGVHSHLATRYTDPV